MAIFKRFDHIGIVVSDLKKATKALAHFFGLEYQEQMEIEEAGIRIAFYSLGVGLMELIEFQRPIDDLDPVVTRPGAGVQHVAWQVEDFEETLKALTDKDPVGLSNAFTTVDKKKDEAALIQVDKKEAEIVQGIARKVVAEFYTKTEDI